MMQKTYLLVFFLAITFNVFSQEKRIKIVHADNTFVDEAKYPGATILSGNVHIIHQGISLKCTKAIQYKKSNFLKAIGNVVINQGDSIIQTSHYSNYNGNTKLAVSWGNVKLKDNAVTLLTDTLNFDRKKQVLYYNDSGTIIDSINTLKSKEGHYYLENKKFVAKTNVVLTNPDYILKSERLDYYTNSKIAYLFGPSRIISPESTIYCEKGFYNTSNDIAHFLKNAKIISKNQVIEGDSLYYNKVLGFSSATGNVIVTDIKNNTISKGGYAEYYKFKDSSFVVKNAMAIIISARDSLFIHGDTLLLTGEQDNRKIRAFHHVKFYKPDLQGACDSIFSNSATGVTTMYKNPILWANDSQITGDTIIFTKNVETNKLDSLKVLHNALIIQKDSSGFNQIKGRFIKGKFTDSDLKDVDVIGNSELLYYLRNDAGKLIGINKSECSKIRFVLKKGDIQSVKFITKPEGITYPESELPKNVRKLRGFIWREAERPKTKFHIYN
ncbi:MAG: OstA-like protein [Flavobacteriaceae bacterium]